MSEEAKDDAGTRADADAGTRTNADAGTRGRGDAEKERAKNAETARRGDAGKGVAAFTFHVSRFTRHVSRFTFHVSFPTFHAASAILALLLSCTAASAKPTQQDVFKSIQENVNESGDAGVKPILLICAGAGVLGLLALFGRRQTRQATPKPLNHPGKLLKEIMKAVPLKPAELKQLKLVVEESAAASQEPLQSPLVLVLCPSVLAKVVQSRSTRADRRVLGQVLKKTVRM